MIRNDLPELFEAFDFADPHATTGLRPQTLVASQGLYLLNDEMVMAAAKSVAERVLATESEPAARVQRMVQLLLGVPASEEQRLQIVQFVERAGQELAAGGESEAELRAWAMACHALVASSRFQILE